MKQPFSGFIGPTYTAQSLNEGAQRCMNLYAQVVESQGEPDQVVYYGSPGKRLVASLPDAPVRAMFYQDTRATILAGSSYFELYSDYTYSRLGSVVNDVQPGTVSCNGALAGHQPRGPKRCAV